MMQFMELMLYLKIKKTWDKQRAIKVINYVREFLDDIIPIENTSWKNISKIKIEGIIIWFFW